MKDLIVILYKFYHILSWTSVVYPMVLIHSFEHSGTHVLFAQNLSVICQVCGRTLTKWYVINIFIIDYIIVFGLHIMVTFLCWKFWSAFLNSNAWIIQK